MLQQTPQRNSLRDTQKPLNPGASQIGISFDHNLMIEIELAALKYHDRLKSHK